MCEEIVQSITPLASRSTEICSGLFHFNHAIAIYGTLSQDSLM
uniref:Uncharacterized protein n=1 Tax=Arundo donax TaxID=35708 RepID=A0A0A9GNS7_ARUDO